MKLVKTLSLTVLMTCLFALSILLISPNNIQASDMIDSAPTLTQDDSYIYLPIISKPLPQQDTIVKLVAPEDGAQLNTLIPTLIFETEAVPDDTGGCLAFSTSPNPTNCMMWFFLDSNTYRERVLWFNLEPNTKYYWRVGAVLNFDDNNTEWSEERTFVTGPSGGEFLPAAVHISPANNSSVDPNTLTIKWNAVPGAVEYELYVKDTAESSWYVMSSTEAQLGPDDLKWIFNYTDSTQFAWSVKARNNYAWGEESDDWNFTVPATTMQSDESVSPNEKDWLILPGKLVYSQVWSAEPSE